MTTFSRLPAILLLLLATAAPAAAQSGAPPSAAAAASGEVLACAPPFGPKSSHAEIVAAFGAANVTFTEIDGAEGEKLAATVVFPKDPKRRLELMWADEKKRSGLLAVRPDKKTTRVAPNGIRRGMSLAEVEKLNGRPFVLVGFDWDYGGSVTDWKGGALATPAPGGCTVSVAFALPETVDGAVAEKVAGDAEFSSSDKEMKAAKPIVDSFTVGYPQP